jgi:hypothetical protein
MPDTGAPYNIPYVESTDLVSGWPAISLDVANAIVAALDGVKVNKKIEAFTSSGTWTVPAGVTYAIAHMMGGGGGVGNGTTSGDGGASSVAFAGGTVSAPGGQKSAGIITTQQPQAGPANSGLAALARDGAAGGNTNMKGNRGAIIVAGDAVTPAASVTVTVGAGGTAGTAGAAGGSGYVYIEYYE